METASHPPPTSEGAYVFNLERAERANILYIRAQTGDEAVAYLRPLFKTKGSWDHFLRTHGPELMRLDIMRKRTGRGDLMLDQTRFREYAEAHLTIANAPGSKS